MTLVIRSEEVRAQALDALSGMSTIVRNDMLVRGSYITSDIVNPDLADKGAICGGRQACAVGSLYLGAGVKPKVTKRKSTYSGHTLVTAELPGADPAPYQGTPRAEYLRRKPALKLAYDALNEAADRYCARNGIDLDADQHKGREVYVMTPVHGSMERLFEAYYDDSDGEELLDLSELPKIIKSAREAIKRGKVGQ